METRRIDDEKCAEIVDELLLDLRRMQQQLEGLEDVDKAQMADVRRAEQYLSIRIEGWQSLVNGLRSGEEEDFSLWQEKEREIERLERGLR